MILSNSSGSMGGAGSNRRLGHDICSTHGCCCIFLILYWRYKSLSLHRDVRNVVLICVHDSYLCQSPVYLQRMQYS